MTVADLARWLQLKESTIRKWVCHGRIPYLKIGASVRFSQEDIEQWLLKMLPILKPPYARARNGITPKRVAKLVVEKWLDPPVSST